MQIKPIIAALGLVLAGCSDHPRIDGGAGAAVATLGTPFLIAFKAPICVVTLAVAGPSAAGLELTGYTRITNLELRQELDQGVRQNCGVPYVVTP